MISTPRPLVKASKVLWEFGTALKIQLGAAVNEGS